MIRPALMLLLLLVLALPALAEVEWQVDRNVTLASAPVDMTSSADGQRVFVLLEGGEVRVYDAAGQQQEVIKLDGSADKIAVSPDGERLILSDSKTRQMKIVSIDYVKQIDISGSPFKGPANAKVVVAVYSDFQ